MRRYLRLRLARVLTAIALRVAPQGSSDRTRLEIARARAEARAERPLQWQETLVSIFRTAILVGFLVALPIVLIFTIKGIGPAFEALIVLSSWAAGFTAEILVELLYRFHLQGEILRLRQDEWLAESDFERLLIDFRSYYRTIRADRRPDPDLFASYYHDRFRSLGRQMTLSATSKQLLVNQTHFDLTDILMACLAGGDTDDFLAIHFLRDNTFFRDVPHARRYLRLFEEKLNKGEVRVVRRLFVVDDDVAEEQLTDEFSTSFIALHASPHTKFDYRIIKHSTYRQYLADREVNDGLVEDFGVYGNWYVYETDTATARLIRGTFTADQEKIRMYRAHFERCWLEGCMYNDLLPSTTLPDVRTTSQVLDPFTRAQQRVIVAKTHLSSPASETGGDEKAMHVHAISSTGAVPAEGDAVAAISSILDGVALCSVATTDFEGEPHIHTCFYAHASDPLRMWFLTPPLTQHSQNVEAHPKVAVAIYSTEQEFTAKKSGLQLFGPVRRVPDDEVAEPLSAYLARFPALKDGLRDPSSLDGLESRFYEVLIERARIFDEPRFGSEVWVDVKLHS